MIIEADRYGSNDPHKSLALFEKSKELSSVSNFPEGIIRSELGQARALFGLGEPVKALDHLSTAKKLAKESKFKNLETNARETMIRIYLGIRKLELADDELDTIQKIVFAGKDTTQMIKWYSLKSRALDAKYDIAAAMQYADSAQEMAMKFNVPGMNAMVDYTIAGIFFSKDDFSKARNYFLQAAAYYESVGHLLLLLPLYTNIMATYQAENKYDSAMFYIDKQVEIQEKVGSKIGKLTTGQNRARLLVDMGKFQEAKEQVRENLNICRQTDADSTNDLYWMGIVHRGLDQYDKAAEYIKQAYNISMSKKNYGKCAFYAQALYQTYYWKKHYNQALEWYKYFRQFNDSINSAKQQEQIKYYTARFETVEREKEIIKLKSDSEINRLKRNRLIGILSTIILIGSMLIVFLVSRNRRNNKIFESEKSLAEARQHQAELKHALLLKDLDMKKQELASGMLQIAKKNEFLIGLKEDMEHRIREVDPEVKRILKSVQQEISSEEEWDSFISSFRDVHPSYMKKLTSVSDGLSKSETKLACLLKMNLSSKEIANMLNISSEGIKKARYRLRKKLGLETDTDLHEYLLALE